MESPKIILGEDAFAGWGNNSKFTLAERIDNYANTLRFAYASGIRGYAMSPVPYLIPILKSFKESHPDIICFANPHKGYNYYFNGNSLWDSHLRQRILATEKIKLIGLNQPLRQEWYGVNSGAIPFSDKEISQIMFNRNEFQDLLSAFDFCDYSLVGNISHGFLYLAGRHDVVEEQVELVKHKNLTPVAICEGGVEVLSKIQSLDVQNIWVWYNSRVAADER
ncbi:MAG: hypothetical protein ACMXYF_01780 [Candidatus Woesearchaeota archaeon]